MDLAAAVAALRASPDHRVVERFTPPEGYPVPDQLRDSERRVGAVIDLETTGLDPLKDEIIELGIVKFTFTPEGFVDRVTHSYSFLRMPTVAISEEITRITGITDDMVAGKILPDDEINELMDDVVLIIAMNAGFDRRFLEPLYAWARNKRWACAMKEIDWKGHGAPSQVLQMLAWWQGFFYEGHRACIDCAATLHLLTHWFGPGQPFMAELLENARNPSYRVWAVNSPFSLKDTLKARGYFWEPYLKCWYRDLRDSDAVADEEKWLRENKTWHPVTKTLTALHRYSNRENEQ